MRERRDEKCDGARFFRSRVIDLLEIKVRRDLDANISTLFPIDRDADRTHHFNKPLHLLDSRHAPKGRCPFIKQRGRQHGHRGVL